MIATTSLIAVKDDQISTGRVGWGLHEFAIKAFASQRSRITAPFRGDRRDDPRGPQRAGDGRSFAGRAGTRLSSIDRFIWQWPRQADTPARVVYRATTAGKGSKAATQLVGASRRIVGIRS